MNCKIYNNKSIILEKLKKVRYERLRLMGTPEIKEFDKNLKFYIYCDGKYHTKTNGYEDFVKLCPGYSKSENLIKGAAIAEKTKNFDKPEQTFQNWKGDKKIINKLQKFMLDFQYYNCVLFGKNGTGKSHLSRSLQIFEIERNTSVFFITAKELEAFFISAESKSYQLNEKNYAKEQIEKIINSQLIIIDDLGTEKLKSESFLAGFTELLDKKQGKLLFSTNLKFTTNVNFPNMENKQGYLNYRYNTRIMSRLLEKILKIDLSGSDFRLKK